MTPTPEKLEPLGCPFCGVAPVICGGPPDMFTIECQSCKEMRVEVDFQSAFKKDVIKAWNTRPADPRLAELEDQIYPHMCQIEHVKIGHSYSETEACPLCDMRDERDTALARVDVLEKALEKLKELGCDAEVIERALTPTAPKENG